MTRPSVRRRSSGGDRPRQAEAVHRLDEVDGQVRDQAGDDDAAGGRPHVPDRDVAPPAVVEAEGDEDDELDPDDEPDRPVEQLRYLGGSPLSKRSSKASHHESATIAPSTRSCQSRCGESSWRIRRGWGRPSARRRQRAPAPRRGCPARAAGRSSPPPPAPSPAASPARSRGSAWTAAGGAASCSRSPTRFPPRQRRADRVALGRAADEEVVDVARLVLRDLHELAEAELGVAGRRSAARLVPARELRQEDAQERGLQLVEARVVADELEVRLVAGAVEGKKLDAVGELLVVGRDEPAVAEAEEVLGRIEAEGRDRAVPGDLRASRTPAPRPRARGRRARRAAARPAAGRIGAPG